MSFNESQHASGGSHELAIADISSSWVTGLRLSGVRVIGHDTGAEGGGAEPAKPGADSKQDLKIDSVVVRLALLPLLVGSHNVTFHADAFGGKIDGSFHQHGLDESFDVSLEAIDVGRSRCSPSSSRHRWRGRWLPGNRRRRPAGRQDGEGQRERRPGG